MTFTLYPDPATGVLSVPAGATVVTPFVAHAAPRAEFDPPYVQTMFIRVAMLGGDSVPKLSLTAGTGDAIEVSNNEQGVFAAKSAGKPQRYLGDVWLDTIGFYVYDITMGFVSADTGLAWRLTIGNTDNAEGQFTWVVADDPSDIVQPWVDPGPADLQVAATIAVNGKPMCMDVDLDGHTVYVGQSKADSLAVIDLSTLKRAPDIPIGDAAAVVQDISGIAVDTDADTVFVNGVRAIDLKTHAVSQVRMNRSEGVLALDRERRILYSACTFPFMAPAAWVRFGGIFIINADTYATIGEVVSDGGDIDKQHRPMDLAIGPMGEVYFTDMDGTALQVIDPATRRTTKIEVGKPTLGVAVNPVSGHLYVSCPNDNAVVVIDTTSHKITATIPAGTRPTGVAVDPTKHTVYIVNSGDNTITAIDDRTARQSVLAVGDGPTRIAVDPIARTAVVANTDDGSLSIIQPPQ
jgi:YVTN family beta-propeller protein